MDSRGPDVDAALKKGDLKFTLHGKKLKGSWVLVRLRPRGAEKRAGWLLIKHRDEFASTRDIAEEEPRSVVSKRILVEIARDEGGDLEKAATGDPPALLRKLAKNPKLVTPPRRGRKKAVWHSNRGVVESSGASVNGSAARAKSKPARVPFRVRRCSRRSYPSRSTGPAGSTRRSTTATASSPTRRGTA